MLKSNGILRYSPKKLGEYASPNWWLILVCDDEIGRYYRHLYHLSTYRIDQLQRSHWKSHISVVRNEKPLNENEWEKHAHETIEFQYNPEIETNGKYFWLSVVCPQLEEIRSKLGLGNPMIPLHLTIGHHI